MATTFDDIAGQEAACSALLQNIRRDKVASAYLFKGPDGTGKTLAARIFAKALLCSGNKAGGPVPCGECKSCVMFEAGSHPDFFSVSKEGAAEYEKSGATIIVEQMRDLISSISLKSCMGGRKVAVIHGAETMKGPPANAFLKTLEEPPPDVVIILVTDSPSALLPTIISRCRQVPFTPMEPSKLAVVLEKRLGTTAEEAFRAAMLAEGCVGRALGGATEGVREVDDEAAGLMAGLVKMPADEVVGFAEKWKKRERKDLPVLLERMAEILRMSQGRNSAIPSDIIRQVSAGFGGAPGDRAGECFDMLMEAISASTRNPNVQLFLEALIFDMQSVLQRGHRIGTQRY